MKKLNVDSGLQEFALGGGVLRFNPGDPNLYMRFLQALEQMQKLHSQMLSEAENGGNLAALMVRFDSQIKQQLDGVFGAGNDFDRLLGGVNVFAPGRNGESVLVNLLTALHTVLEEGVRLWTDAKVQQAVAASKRRKQA